MRSRGQRGLKEEVPGTVEVKRRGRGVKKKGFGG